MTEKLRAYPQTEREANQVATVALLVLLNGDTDGEETKLFVPKEHIKQYSGMGVALFLEETVEGLTLTVELVE